LQIRKDTWGTNQIWIQGVESKHHISKNPCGSTHDGSEKENRNEATNQSKKKRRTFLVRDEQRGHGGADIADPGEDPAVVEVEKARGRRRHGDDEPVWVAGGAERGGGGGEDGEGGEEVDGGQEEEEEGRGDGDAEDPEAGVGLRVVVIPEPVGGDVLEMRPGRGPRAWG
jgi:hypothetical protein